VRFIVRVLITILTCSLVAVPSAMAQSRGELLYTTHCISCHTTEMHWRENRSAGNWASLKVQVRRWQDAASLAWSDGDIQDVSRYLNESIYHFEQSADPVSSLSAGGHESVSRLNRRAPDPLP
jgi:mono/diheme cytochrome c family protein